MSLRRMSSREARANFADLLGSVYYTKEPVIIERKGKPFAVVISPEDYEVLKSVQEGTFAPGSKDRNEEESSEDVLSGLMAEFKSAREEVAKLLGGKNETPEGMADVEESREETDRE